MQGTPAGLPLGIPGIGLVIDGAMQHAPQLSRQFMAGGLVVHGRVKNGGGGGRHFTAPRPAPAELWPVPAVLPAWGRLRHWHLTA